MRVISFDVDEFTEVFSGIVLLLLGVGCKNTLDVEFFLYDIDLSDQLTAWKVPLSPADCLLSRS